MCYMFIIIVSLLVRLVAHVGTLGLHVCDLVHSLSAAAGLVNPYLYHNNTDVIRNN